MKFEKKTKVKLKFWGTQNPEKTELTLKTIVVKQ